MNTTFRSTCLLILAAAVIFPGCGGGVASVPQVVAIPHGAGPPPPPPRRFTGDPGTFSGRIVFDGTPPKVARPPSFKPNDDRTDRYCAARRKNVFDLSLIVNPQNNGVKNVLVYLVKEPHGNMPSDAPTVHALFDQKDCTFQPRVLLVRTGQTIKVTNSDQTVHNTHTYPGLGETGISQAQVANSAIQFSYSISQVAPVPVGCDIHSWMSAYHLPLDHDLAAVTDKNGNFKIDGLPPGVHHFRIWHERAGRDRYLDKNYTVVIEPDQTVHQTLTFKASRFSR